MVSEHTRTTLLIQSGCTNTDEFVSVFRPLCHENVLFVATEEPARLGLHADFEIRARDGQVVLEGEAEVVSPFAHGIATAGYNGMALRIASLRPGSESTLIGLHTITDGTLPFGVPHGSARTGHNPVVCTVSTQETTIGLSGRAPTKSDAVPQPVMDGLGWNSDAHEGTAPSDERQTGFGTAASNLRSNSGSAAPPLAASLRSKLDTGPTAITSLTSHDATEIISLAARHPVLGTVFIATIAATMGLAGGYLLWGRAQISVEQVAQVSAVIPSLVGPPDAAVVPPTVEPSVVRKKQSACTATISSQPEGAALFIADKLMGKTPYKGDVPCGLAIVSLHMPQYQAEQQSMEFTANEPKNHNVALKRPILTVLIKTKPSRATIRVAGNKVGKSPLTVMVPGYEPVQVSATKPGYAIRRHELTALGGQTKLILKLRRKR